VGCCRVRAHLLGFAPCRLIEVLQLGPLLRQPVRSLPLGQRMRSELAAAVLPRPRVLFLDEPTIGLEVEAKAAVRGFLR
jgi:viologen exporter family transport system ATP-binding protein